MVGTFTVKISGRKYAIDTIDTESNLHRILRVVRNLIHSDTVSEEISCC